MEDYRGRVLVLPPISPRSLGISPQVQASAMASAHPCHSRKITNACPTQKNKDEQDKKLLQIPKKLYTAINK
jgi:hypothetical protein